MMTAQLERVVMGTWEGESMSCFLYSFQMPCVASASQADFYFPLSLSITVKNDVSRQNLWCDF